MDPQQIGNFSDSLDSNNDRKQANLPYSKMSEIQKEAEFLRQHQEYVAIKLARKRELRKKIKEEFSSFSSSSDDNDNPPASQEPPRQPKVEELKEESKRQQKISEPIYNEDKACVLVPGKVVGEWMKETMVFSDNKTLYVCNYIYEIQNFTKIKIVYEPIMGIHHKIKFTYNQNEALLTAASNGNSPKGLPFNYEIFAKIIQCRLVLTSVALKTMSKEQQIVSFPSSVKEKALICGKLLKKSQVLGKWDERYIVITKEGIFSHKKPTEKHSMSIPEGSIKEIETEWKMKENSLVIKVEYSSKKTQFGLPLTGLTNPQCWLYHFYLMMKT